MEKFIKGFTRLESILLGSLLISVVLVGWALVPASGDKETTDESSDDPYERGSLHGSGSVFEMFGIDPETDGDAEDAIPSLKGKKNLPAPRRKSGPAKKPAAKPSSQKPAYHASAHPAAKKTSKPSGTPGKGSSQKKKSPPKKPRRRVKIPGVKAEILDAPPGVMDILVELENAEWGRETEKKLIGAVRRWARQDVEAAADFALSIERRATRNSALNNAMSTWLASSPHDALEWFNRASNEDPFLLGDLTSSFYSRVASKQPLAAMEGVWDLPTASLKTRALHQVSQKLMNIGHEEDVLGMYDVVESDEDKRIVLNVVMQKMARYEPEELGAWVFELPDPAHQKIALNSFVSAWSRDYPSAAAEWVAQQIPPEADKARHMSTVIGAWVREDPTKAGEWLLTQFPPTRETDPAVNRFARAVLSQDPGYAAAWSHSVVDNNTRWSLMEQIAVKWKQTDPATAREYINQTDIPQWKKARLLK